ncbi:MAG: phosphoribosylformylglycinamidine synthase I [Planctomycetes bacterium]|nr:phosphoribosylformylglycinamidine synthase I [Planctomycetota bacterium]
MSFSTVSSSDRISELNSTVIRKDMVKINALVLRAAGTNCNEETEYAFSLVGINPVSVHINQLIENPRLLLDFQILAIAGGFSYGDDVGAGRLFANEIKYKINDVFLEFVSRENLIIGICNGFQVLVRLGILPGDMETSATANPGLRKFPETSASLHWNDSHKFEDRWCHLEIPANNNSIFLKDLDNILLPVAHAEGKFIIEEKQKVEMLEKSGQIALKFVNKSGGNAAYPDNPNGSMYDIAGISDKTGRILGLMPHPERFLHHYNSPFWSKESEIGEGEGLQLFKNAESFFA